MVHFLPVPTCQNLCALPSLYEVGSVVAVVVDLIGNIAVLPDLLREMNEIASVLEVVLEGHVGREIVPWILAILTVAMTTATGVMMIDGSSGNETIPTSNVSHNYAPNPVRRSNLELDPQAIPYHRHHRAKDHP